MFGNRDKQDNAGKELKKLRRVDLLELLLDQSRENDAQAARIAELEGLVERLKAKLDEKDGQIEHLKQRLDDKDAQIADLRQQTRAVDMLNMHELLEVEERAVKDYLDNLGAPDDSAIAASGASAGPGTPEPVS